MAALNTLRTKGGVVLAVIIGLSLLAFLLGDFTNTSSTLFNSSKMNVGVINGVTIPVQEYSDEIEKLTLVQQMLTGSESMNEQQTDAVRNQSWDKIIRENLFTSSLENLGLVVSDDEKIDMVSGEFTSPVLTSIFVDPNSGKYDHQMVLAFVSSIDVDPSGRAGSFWSYMESEMSNERELSKYFSLIKNGIYTTESEAKVYFAALENDAKIDFVTKATSTVADSLVKVSDSEIKAYYNQHKESFKQVANRKIEYVLFESLPSNKDYADAKEEVSKIADEFAKATDLAQFVNLNSTSQFDQTYRKAEELPSDLAAFAFSKDNSGVFGPSIKNDIYSMSRVVDIKQLPDSLGAKHILLPQGSDLIADSLITVLKKDKSKFSEISAQLSIDKNANVSGGDLGVFPMNMMIPEFSSAIAASKEGEIIKVATQFGIHVVEVTKIGEKFPKVQIATVDYTVDPSNETNQIIYSKATDFASKATKNGADFDEVISETGASKRLATLSAGDRQIQGIAGSAEIVRWAFSSKAGDVSSVISIGEQNIIVKVAEVGEHGYATVSSASSDIARVLREKKKGDLLAAEIKGMTSLDDIAKKWDVEVKNSSDVNFGSYYIQGLGVAPKVIGAVTTLKAGETSDPIIATNSVSVVKVAELTKNEKVTLESEKALLEATSENMYQQRVMGSIYANGDIIDERIKFF